MTKYINLTGIEVGPDGNVEISDEQLAEIEAHRSSVAGARLDEIGDEWGAVTNNSCEGSKNTADCVNSYCSEKTNWWGLCGTTPTENKSCNNTIQCDGRVTNQICGPMANASSCKP